MISEISSQDDVKMLFTIFSDVWGSETLSELVSSIQNTKCLLCKNDGDVVVGYVFYDIDQRDNFIEITDFAIDTYYRNQGYGKELLSAVCNQANCIRLTVKDDNFAAKNVYTSLGFREIHKFQNYYGVGQDGTRMEKRG